MKKKSSSLKDYLVKSLNGMALGLFSSLIIGLIIKQLGTILGLDLLIEFGNIAQRMMGPAIGAGIAHSLGAPALGILASIAAGAIGAGSLTLSAEGGVYLAGLGEPVGAYISALVAAEASKLVEGKTDIDIILVPISSILLGGLVGVYISPGIASLMNSIGNFINMATDLHPLPMGIIISVVMGMLLTLPISSAAIAISLNLSGLAAGAATVGCAANMVGFAVISYRDNGFGGFIAQGLGTSMLQISNIFQKPRIWLPIIVSSALLGPVSSVILKLESNSIGAGMGTSGLVGQVAMIDTMGYSTSLILKMVGLHLLLPGIISYLVAEMMRSRGLIRPGDMEI